jgi:hypothetical protein
MEVVIHLVAKTVVLKTDVRTNTLKVTIAHYRLGLCCTIGFSMERYRFTKVVITWWPKKPKIVLQMDTLYFDSTSLVDN